MRVAFFYTTLHSEVIVALEKYASNAEMIETPVDDKYAYWKEFAARWDKGEDLLILEQYKEITSETIPSLEQCPHDWCCYAYNIFEPPVLLELGFGCTKFSAKAQKVATLDLILNEPRCIECDGTDFRCWNHFDLATGKILSDAGIKPHVHGEIKNHHSYKPNDTIEVGSDKPTCSINRVGITNYSWTPETGSTYSTEPLGPRKTWGIEGIRD